MLPIIHLPYNPIGSWTKGNPYATVWVHQPHGSFVVFGGMRDIEILFLQGNVYYTYTYWWKGKKRSGARFGDKSITIHSNKKGFWNEINGARKNYFVVKNGKVVAEFNRLPSSYPKFLLDKD